MEQGKNRQDKNRNGTTSLHSGFVCRIILERQEILFFCSIRRVKNC